MDLSKIKSDFKREIIRGGEAYLDGQVQIATSADSRASNLAGVFTTAATALFAGVVIGLFDNQWNTPDRLPLLIGGAVAGLMFLLAATQCVRAIIPTPFWLPGCEPDNWIDDVQSGKALDACLGERAQHIQKQIEKNSEIITQNAKRFEWGAKLGIAAPIVGIVFWLAMLGVIALCRVS